MKKRKPNKAEWLFIVLLGVFVILTQLFEHFFLTSNTVDVLSLTAFPIILGVLAGGPVVGIPVSIIWSVTSLLYSHTIVWESFLLILLSRILMVFVLSWSYDYFRDTKIQNQKGIFYSILIGVLAKRIYLSVFFSLTPTPSNFNIIEEIFIILFQSLFYSVCVQVIIKAFKEHQEHNQH